MLGRKDAPSTVETGAPMSSHDLIAAIAALRGTDETPALQKIVIMIMVPIVVAIVVGLLAWVGTTVSGVGSSIASMQTSLVMVQKSVDALTAKQSDEHDKIAELVGRVGQHDLRLNNLEQSISRQNDRIRIAEGQKPLNPNNLQ